MLCTERWLLWWVYEWLRSPNQRIWRHEFGVRNGPTTLQLVAAVGEWYLQLLPDVDEVGARVVGDWGAGVLGEDVGEGKVDNDADLLIKRINNNSVILR